MIVRRPAIERRVGSSLILVAPGSDEVRLLGPTAAVVWQTLVDVQDPDRLSSRFWEWYPNVAEEARAEALRSILVELEADGLVRRS